MATIRLLQDQNLSGYPFSAGDLVEISATESAWRVSGGLADDNAAAIAQAVAEGEVVINVAKFVADKVKQQNSSITKDVSDGPNIYTGFDDPRMPAPEERGVGPIWIDGVQYWSDGVGFKPAGASSTANNRLIADRANADEFINFADHSPSVVSFASAGTNATIMSSQTGDYVEATTTATPASNNFGGVKVSSVNAIGGLWDMSGTTTYPTGTADTVFYLELEGMDSGTGNETQEALGFRVYFVTGAASVSTDTSFADYYNIQLGTGIPIRKNGRQVFAFRLSDMAASGTPNIAQVRRIEIRAMNYTKSTEEGTKVRFYGLYTNVKRKGRVLFSFDDGYSAIYTDIFKKYFKPNNWAASLGINSGTIGLAGRLTVDKIKEIESGGFEISNHTSNHTALVWIGSSSISGTGPWTTTYSFSNHGYNIGDTVTVTGSSQPIVNGTKTITAVTTNTFDVVETVNVDNITGAVFGTCSIPNKSFTVADITNNRDWIEANGLTESDMFIYPGGQNDLSAQQLVKSLGFTSARGTGNSGRPIYNTGQAYGLGSPFDLPTAYLTNTETAASILAKVDSVLLTGGDIHVYGHNFVTTPALGVDFSLSELGILVAGIKSRISSGLCDIPTLPSKAIINF